MLETKTNGNPKCKDCSEIFNGEVIIPDMPIKRSKFIKFEPIIFPSPKSVSFLVIAIIDVTSSGKDVPKPTIVRPIIVSETPKALDKLLALFTNVFAPTAVNIAEKIKSKIVGSIFACVCCGVAFEFSKFFEFFIFI